MRILNLIFALLFLISAILQYNDPDPWLWIPIYLFAAFLAWRAFRGILHRQAMIGGILVFGVYAVYLFFTENGVLDWITKHEAENIAASMQATKPWIEDTREFFGLLIIILLFTANLLHRRSRPAV